MAPEDQKPTPDAGPGAANGGTPNASPAAPDPASQLADLQARYTEVSDAFLRAKAEAENIRRRAEDEMAKARKYAVESFAESLVPVKDSLEAAIAIESATPQQLLEGVHATLRQLIAALERNKVAEINPPAGTKFDPHRHQAISTVESDAEPNTVVQVFQKGYLLNDRVIRPAMVAVAKSHQTG